jgi:transcriptional regulator
MYVPKHFEETNVNVLHYLIAEHSLGALVTVSEESPDANHIPFLVHAEPEPYGMLHGHVARANPVWRQYQDEPVDTRVSKPNVLVIFQGPQAFVSPSWYPTKQETGKVVPTWNYVVVHAHGRLRVVDDPAWVRAHLEELTRQHEGHRDAPWKITDAPADYIDKMVDAVVGIEIPIVRLVGKWKVSQNRPPRDRDGVARGLAREGSPAANAIASLVSSRSTRLPGPTSK